MQEILKRLSHRRPSAEKRASACSGGGALLSERIWVKFDFDLIKCDPSDVDLDRLQADIPALAEDFSDIQGLLSPIIDDDDFFDTQAHIPPGMLNDDEYYDLQTDFPPEPSIKELHNRVVNHDCMWAGSCSDQKHKTDEPKTLNTHNRPQQPLTASVAPGPEKTPAAKQQPVAAGRSLLLKTVAKASPAPVLPSLDSPPISDDEDPKGQTSTLKMLNDAIEECDIDEDSDLCEYFGEDGDFIADELDETAPAPKPHSAPPKIHSAPPNDHSYHKDKNASMRMENLGIETPSDSEEEIDVVSIGEKNRIGYNTLPTIPSSQYQEHLEHKVKSVITNRRPPGRGIKTLPPIRKCSSSSSGESSPSKSRGIKRPRHHHSREPHQTYKRRAIQASNGSDSEPELEKRSLHNNMERQRRVDLRNAFENLRKLVPRLSVIDRAAKVQILQDSRDYCYQLTTISENMTQKEHELRRQQHRLRNRLSHLRRSLAAKRYDKAT